MKRRNAIAIGLLTLAVALSPALADIVHMKDGRKFEGKVTEQGDRLVIRMGSIKTTVARDQVARIEKKLTPREEYKQRLAAVRPDDTEALYDLGMWCLEKKLPTQARDCFGKVIQINRGHQEAHRRLGHVIRDGVWVTPCLKCGSTGMAKCPLCRGAGNARVTCGECLKGKKVCEACGGRGFLVCPNCQGMGGFTCEVCRGTGGYWANEWVWVGGMYVNQPVWHGCPACQGNGGIDCPNCVRGKLDCKRCKKGTYKCPSCDGKGYTRPACKACQGARKVNCAHCLGAGFTPVFPPPSPPKPKPTPLPRLKNEPPGIQE